MSYEMTKEVKGQTLFVTAAGRRTGRNVAAIAKDVLDECRRSNVTEVFIDLRDLKGRMDVSDSLLVITEVFPSINLFRHVKRVAVIETPDRDERSRFFERVAHSRGFNIRMFDDPERAQQWLAETISSSDSVTRVK
jgi:hypothetical protein